MSVRRNPPSPTVAFLAERVRAHLAKSPPGEVQRLAERAGVVKSVISQLSNHELGAGTGETQRAIARALGIDSLDEAVRRWQGGPVGDSPTPTDDEMNKRFPNLARAFDTVSVTPEVAQRARRAAYELQRDVSVGIWCALLEDLAREAEAGAAPGDKTGTGPIALTRATQTPKSAAK